jgi:saccharopine dehydrogenase (NAD+, L-lysine forming)
MKIGIIREGRIPPDLRVPFTPEQCMYINDTFQNLEIVVQPSSIRCFSDEEYASIGIKLQEDLSDCEVLMGVKEVPVSGLIPEKTYFFFSHTLKKQVHNREMLREILRKEIRLVDYETLKDQSGQRIIGFGRFAGLVGSYNGIRAYGIRHHLFELKPAWRCVSVKEMKEQLTVLRLPAMKIVVTGGGRVGSGVMEMLDVTEIRQVTPEDYLLKEEGKEAVAVQLNPGDYNLNKAGLPFDLDHFFKYPGEYTGNFRRFLPKTDLLIAAAYWDPKAPVLFYLQDTRRVDFRISVIADITCDIRGSIPTTRRASTLAEPFYDFNPETYKEEIPFSGEKNITVMAVDNLPCEVPRDSSFDFGNNLIEKVLPFLNGEDPDLIIDRATITRNGALTEKYSYLQDFLDGKINK